MADLGRTAIPIAVLVLLAASSFIVTLPAGGSSRTAPVPGAVLRSASAPASCTNCVIASIPIPFGPSSIAFDPVNDLLYVADQSEAELTAINGTTNSVAETIAVGTATEDAPNGISVDTSTNHLFVPDDSNDNVTVVGTSPFKTVKSIVVKPNPFSSLYDPDNQYIYVGSEGVTTAWISVLNGTSEDHVTNISLGSNVNKVPIGLALDTTNGELFAGDAQGNNLTVIDTLTKKIVASVSVGYDPESIAYDPANGLLYAADTEGENISVVNGSTNLPIASLQIGTDATPVGPIAVAYDAENGCVYAPS